MCAHTTHRCVAEYSKVKTKEGYKSISEIEIGDEVLTIKGWRHVSNKFNQGKQELIRISYISGYLDCTLNHRVALIIDGVLHWKYASELSPDDYLVSVSYNDKVKISLVKIQSLMKLSERIETYDIEVEEDNCFVCEDILVHNSSTPNDEIVRGITGDTWVNTVFGPRQISELVDNNVTIRDGDRINEITGLDKSLQDVLLLITEKGYSVKLSEYRSLLVKYDGYDAWMAAKHIQEGDKITICNCNVNMWDGFGDKDLGWLIGVAMTSLKIINFKKDGGYYLHLKFSTCDYKNLLKKAITNICSRYKYSVVNYGYGDLIKLHDESLLEGDLLKMTEDNVTVTSNLEKTSYDFYVGYIEGLYDTLGSLMIHSDGKKSMHLGSLTEENAKCIQRMLSRLGMISSIVHKVRNLYNVVISDESYDKFAAKFSKHNIPGEFIPGCFNFLGLKNLLCSVYEQSYTDKETTIFDTVVSIQKCEKEYVYDLIDNNVICTNCIKTSNYH